MGDFFWFSDAQWARIEPLLPTVVRGKPRMDDRRVLSGIVHALRCGRALVAFMCRHTGSSRKLSDGLLSASSRRDASY